MSGHALDNKTAPARQTAPNDSSGLGGIRTAAWDYSFYITDTRASLGSAAEGGGGGMERPAKQARRSGPPLAVQHSGAYAVAMDSPLFMPVLQVGPIGEPARRRAPAAAPRGLSARAPREPRPAPWRLTHAPTRAGGALTNHWDGQHHPAAVPAAAAGGQAGRAPGNAGDRAAAPPAAGRPPSPADRTSGEALDWAWRARPQPGAHRAPMSAVAGPAAAPGPAGGPKRLRRMLNPA